MFCSNYFTLFLSVLSSFRLLSFWNRIFLLFPCSFILVFLPFLSLSYRFYLRHFCHYLFMAHYTFGLTFFCQSFESLVCPHSLLNFFFMLFYSLLYICCCCCCSLKTIDFLYFCFLLPYSFSRPLSFSINCCSWNSTSFLLFVKFVSTLLHCSFSRLSRNSTIAFPPSFVF